MPVLIANFYNDKFILEQKINVHMNPGNLKSTAYRLFMYFSDMKRSRWTL
ncbi:MAG: hypothetical protein JWQ38_2504 [Flavipsychrobacter sp.]|nr:hypothetical protein [Flavipsychrobacter sp.]